MMKERKIGFFLLGILLLALPMLAACGDGEPSESVTITIGNHTDATGVASNAMAVITMALQDTIDYYNEENLIPGVELELVNYDNQYDPARDVPGYQMLKQEGAKVIFGTVASTGVTLKPFLQKDKIVMIMMSPNKAAFDPPGWVFALGNTRYDEQIFTLLKWISQNDPDFPSGRPARIGGAMLNESAGQAILEAAEEYANANPEYDWVEGFLPQLTFKWDSQAEALKDCDYVFPAVPPQTFVKDYREAGGRGKFIGTDAHVAFMGQIYDAELWDEMDGMYAVRPFRWWTDDSEYTLFTKQLLKENHPDRAEEIIRNGVGYITVQPAVMLLEAIRETVEEMGAEDFTSEALYDHLQSFSINFDGCHHSFSQTKRTSNDYVNIHQLDAERKDFFLAHEGWIPILTEP
ncbi:MAG: ABC transporter substrate-binding protein [Dehalococcoidia bacterium]